MNRIKCLGMITLVLVFTALAGSYSYGEKADLVAHWKFDENEGSKVKDSSEMGNDGKIRGGARVKGVFGSALQFDGKRGYVDCGYNASYDIADDITIEAWVKPISYSEPFFIVVMKDISKSVETYGYSLAIVSAPEKQWNQVLYFSTGDSTWFWNAWYGSDQIPLNIWTHVAVTYDASSDEVPKFYINGQQSMTNVRQDRGRTAINHNEFGITMFLGCSSKADLHYFGDRHSNGLIDEVRIYKKVLTKDKIRNQYKTGFEHLPKGAAGIPKQAASFPPPQHIIGEIGPIRLDNSRAQSFIPTEPQIKMVAIRVSSESGRKDLTHTYGLSLALRKTRGKSWYTESMGYSSLKAEEIKIGGWTAFVFEEPVIVKPMETYALTIYNRDYTGGAKSRVKDELTGDHSWYINSGPGNVGDYVNGSISPKQRTDLAFKVYGKIGPLPEK